MGFRELIQSVPNRGIPIEKANEIQNLVEAKKLAGVIICRKGENRSVEAADVVSGFGYPMRYIEGGLEAINALPKEEKERFAEAIADVPYVFATIEPGIESNEFREIIEIINRARKAKNKMPVFLQSNFERIPYMLQQHGFAKLI